MIEECDDGDFDFFDIVIEWGEWVCCNGNKIKRWVLLLTAAYFISEICRDYEWNEWEERDLNHMLFQNKIKKKKHNIDHLNNSV